MLELSVPCYVEAELHELQHPQPSRLRDFPYPWTDPTYGANSQLTPPPYTTPILSLEKCIRLKRVILKFLLMHPWQYPSINYM